MRESFWGVFVVVTGVVLLGIIYFFQSITNTDEQNYYLLKETSESSLLDSIDVASYRINGEVKINREKFVEVFVRRFAENADLSNSYQIEIYDINEKPPKVSLLVKTNKNGVVAAQLVEFDVTNKIDAILEMPYNNG